MSGRMSEDTKTSPSDMLAIGDTMHPLPFRAMTSIRFLSNYDAVQPSILGFVKKPNGWETNRLLVGSLFRSIFLRQAGSACKWEG